MNAPTKTEVFEDVANSIEIPASHNESVLESVWDNTRYAHHSPGPGIRCNTFVSYIFLFWVEYAYFSIRIRCCGSIDKASALVKVKNCASKAAPLLFKKWPPLLLIYHVSACFSYILFIEYYLQKIRGRGLDDNAN